MRSKLGVAVLSLLLSYIVLNTLSLWIKPPVPVKPVYSHNILTVNELEALNQERYHYLRDLLKLDDIKVDQLKNLSEQGHTDIVRNELRSYVNEHL